MTRSLTFVCAGMQRIVTDFVTLQGEREAPEPYCRGDRGYQKVIEMLEDAAHGQLGTLRPGESATIASALWSGHV